MTRLKEVNEAKNSPIVVVKKNKDGRLRICVDYEVKFGERGYFVSLSTIDRLLGHDECTPTIMFYVDRYALLGQDASHLYRQDYIRHKAWGI